MRNAPTDIQHWAHFEMAKRDVTRIAKAMNEASVQMMVLKGMSLITGYGRDAAQRPISDADLLFCPSDYHRAEAVLQGLGLRQRDPGYSAKVYIGDKNHIMLDIHRYPLPILMGKMTADRLLARGRINIDWFDEPIVQLADQDFALHLILNFLKDGCPASNEKRLEQDLRAVLKKCSCQDLLESAQTYELQTAAWLTVDWMVQRGSSSLKSLAKVLKPESRLNQYRGRVLRQAMFGLSESYPELSYGVTRATADSLSYAVGGATLSALRVIRDLFRPTPQNPARRPMKIPK